MERNEPESMELLRTHQEEIEMKSTDSGREEFAKLQILNSREWKILAKILDKIFLMLFPFITLTTVCGYMYAGFLERNREH